MAALPHISRLTAACESFLFVRTACINASGNAAGISRRTASVDFPVFASMNIIDSAHQDTAESVQGVSLRKVGDSVGHKICLDPLERDKFLVSAGNRTTIFRSSNPWRCHNTPMFKVKGGSHFISTLSE